MLSGDRRHQNAPPQVGDPSIGVAKSGVDLEQLVLKSETVVDDVLKQHLRLVQRQQEKVYEELLSVQHLADYIPLLQLHRKRELQKRCRQHRLLRDLRVIPSSVPLPDFGSEAEETPSDRVKPKDGGMPVEDEPAVAGQEPEAPVTGGADLQEHVGATPGRSGRGDEEQLPRRESLQQRSPVRSIPVDMLVNVGCNTYLRARGDDLGKLLIKVGFEFYLEMTLDEALQYLSEKEKLLFKKYAFWSGKCADIKAQIQVLLQAIAAVVEEPALQVFPFA